MGTQKHRSPQEVREEWLRRGISMRMWAIQHDFSPITVHNVLTGKNSGSIGVGHRIAVSMGIKDGVVDDE